MNISLLRRDSRLGICFLQITNRAKLKNVIAIIILVRVERDRVKTDFQIDNANCELLCSGPDKTGSVNLPHTEH